MSRATRRIARGWGWKEAVVRKMEYRNVRDGMRWDRQNGMGHDVPCNGMGHGRMKYDKIGRNGTERGGEDGNIPNELYNNKERKTMDTNWTPGARSDGRLTFRNVAKELAHPTPLFFQKNPNR